MLRWVQLKMQVVVNRRADTDLVQQRSTPSSVLAFKSGENLCQVVDGGTGVDNADSHGDTTIKGSRREQGGAVNPAAS